jgi:hypothetical protein
MILRMPNGTELSRRLPMTNADPGRLLDGTLDAVSRRMTRKELVRALVFLAVGATWAPLAVATGDQLISGGLPRALVVAIAAAWGLATGLALVILLGRAWRRQPSALFAAHQLERIVGISHNLVLNACLVRRTPQFAYAAEAAAVRAIREVRQHPSRLTDANRRRGRLGGVVVLTAAAWLLLLALAVKPLWPSLLRFFGAGVAAPTGTWIELLRPAPDQVVHAGEALEIEFAIRGRPAETATLELRDPAKPTTVWSRCALPRESRREGDDRRRIALSPAEVTGDIGFRVQAGDGALEGVITVHPQPALREIQIQLTPPAETGLPPSQTHTPDLVVAAGTLGTFVVRANVAIRDVLFVFMGEHETRTRMESDPDDATRAAGTVLLAQSGRYRIEFCDQFGYACPHPGVYSIAIIDAADVASASAGPESARAGLEATDSGAAGGDDGAGGENGAQGEAPDTGDGPGSAAAAGEDGAEGGEGEFERALEDFLREHGDDAREAAAGLNGDEARGEGGNESRNESADDDGADPDPDGGRQSRDGNGATGAQSEMAPESGDGAGADGENEADGDGAERDGSEDGGENSGSEPGGSGGGEGTGATGVHRTPERDSNGPSTDDGSDAGGPIALGGRVETLNLLGRIRRGEPIDESMLVEMGWSADRAAAFVKALERLNGVADALPASAPGPAERRSVSAEPGETAVSSGRGLASNASLSPDGARADEDDVRSIAPPPDQRVSRRLRSVLDAYYRSVAREPTRRAR